MKRKLSRRDFLKGSLSVAACCGAIGSYNPLTCLAQSSGGNGKRLVIVNLYGGADGMSWLVPYRNSVYYQRRPTLAIPSSQVIPIDSQVGFNSAWSDMLQVWLDQQMAVIQKVGYPEADLSHFESQDVWSIGKRAKSADDEGWVGRLADLYFSSSFDVCGVGVGMERDFVTSRADVRPLVLWGLEDYQLSTEWRNWRDSQYRREIEQQMRLAHSDAQGLQANVHTAFQGVYSSLDTIANVHANYSSSVAYPENELGWRLSQVAELIHGNIGTKVLYTGFHGWDTHEGQQNRFQTLLSGTASAMAAFVQDLKNMGRWNDTLVLVISEFGRNTYENGSAGTDHGHGNNIVALGGQVNGGFYGPGLSEDDLRQEYLDYEFDFRCVLKEAIRYIGYNPDPVFTEIIPNEQRVRYV